MLNEPVKSQGKNHQIETQSHLNAKATSTDVMHKERVGGQEKALQGDGASWPDATATCPKAET